MPLNCASKFTSFPSSLFGKFFFNVSNKAQKKVLQLKNFFQVSNNTSKKSVKLLG